MVPNICVYLQFANGAVSNVFICKFMKTKAFLDNKHPKINKIMYHNIVLDVLNCYKIN